MAKLFEGATSETKGTQVEDKDEGCTAAATWTRIMDL